MTQDKFFIHEVRLSRRKFLGIGGTTVVSLGLQPFGLLQAEA